MPKLAVGAAAIGLVAILALLWSTGAITLPTPLTDAYAQVFGDTPLRTVLLDGLPVFYVCAAPLVSLIGLVVCPRRPGAPSFLAS